MNILSATIEEAVYNLVRSANIKMERDAYELVCNEVSEDFVKYFIKNAYLANKNQRPLCQDTGQVLVFLKIPQDVRFDGKFIYNAINDAVARCYEENFFRKSVVKDALFDRKNTKNNAPAIVYTEYTEAQELEINVLIKGGGAENKSELLMLSPTAKEIDIVASVAELVNKAGTSACPPTFLGIGIGATAEQALLLSKKAFFEGNQTEKQQLLANIMREYINAYVTTSGFENTIMDIKILSSPTHIACMPVGVSFNCHSLRHGSCKISSKNEIIYEDNLYIPEDCVIEENLNIKRINVENLDEVRNICSGEKVFLNGKIYTARDAAHKRLAEIYSKYEVPPVDLKDKLVFYAGPCPKTPQEVIGPIGPTTSGRMDKFSELVSNIGILGTIGKGERNDETVSIFKQNGIKYFTVYGGISNYLANCVKYARVIAFEELGAEAVYELDVVDFPVVCKF